MKTQNKVFVLFAWIAISLTLSCSQDQTADLQTEENFTQPTLSIERTIKEKLGSNEVVEMMKQLQNTSRFTIIYDGQLLSGIENFGEASYHGDYDFANADFWYFTGNAGDCVSIDVNRISCEMDPVIMVFSGSGDTESLILLTIADDEDTAACEPNCFSYGDPKLEDLSLPASGDYTIAVWDLAGGSCTSGPQSYSIVMTEGNCGVSDADGDGCIDQEDPHPNSNQDANVNIDGCDSGIANVFITGCSTMSDFITDCAVAATDHDDFVSCVAQLTNAWMAVGLISGRDKGKIQTCAAQSNIP